AHLVGGMEIADEGLDLSQKQTIASLECLTWESLDGNGSNGQLDKVQCNSQGWSGVIPEMSIPTLDRFLVADNNLSGSVPGTICSGGTDIYSGNYDQSSFFNISGNNFCPAYPSCVSGDDMGQNFPDEYDSQEEYCCTAFDYCG
ncbi:MAG: hypothetical protein QGI45_11125, partial [Myxococcota bacterium]|nr:hypothetical protein [Myxococcota bacterium]